MENKNSLTTAAALDVAMVDNHSVFAEDNRNEPVFLASEETLMTDNRSCENKAKRMMDTVLTIHQEAFDCLLEALKGTSEENPREVYITIGSEAAFGLSSLELPTVTGLCLSDSGKDILIRMDDDNWVDFWFFDLYDVLKILKEL